jgi:hypothetical protein
VVGESGGKVGGIFSAAIYRYGHVPQ